MVRQYQEKHERIATLLAANPSCCAWRTATGRASYPPPGRGRRAAYSCEEILRALVVMFVEQLPYRAAVSRIDTSEFSARLRRAGDAPDDGLTPSSARRWALSARTLEAMNQALAEFAVNQEKISGGSCAWTRPPTTNITS
ncbi:hypothetical protein HS125_17690 [bacterium]|nr:hypothetical protein [bacterium]